MKIGIFTFHFVHNYGAVLQAFGLQEHLKSMGHEVYIVDYRPRYLCDTYKMFSLNRIPSGSLLCRLKFLLREVLTIPVRFYRYIRFNRFIKDHLLLDDFDGSGQDYQCFIFGSDQIWNPMITNGIDDVFVGNFSGAHRAKLVAYAASVGSLQNLSTMDSNKLMHYTNRFEMLSCREIELTNFLKLNLSKDVFTVLDPVLMAGKEPFQKLLPAKSKKKKPYLLLFSLSANELLREFSYNLAVTKGLIVIEVLSDQISLLSFKVKHSLPVPYFLDYINNAEVVVTSSFHGTALSILFEKEFYFSQTDKPSSERVLNLLRILGLEDRVVYKPTEMNTKTINYAAVNNILEKERILSRIFLSSI